MTESTSFEKGKRDLYQRHVEELSTRTDALLQRVQRGKYDYDDLAELSSILSSIRHDLTGNDTRLSEAIGLPGRLLRPIAEKPGLSIIIL
jgi:hypothetical protein